MARDTRSFFERLTGAVRLDEKETNNELAEPETAPWANSNADEGELTVDVFQTPVDIVIKTMIAGVRPEDLDISITRDMVSIKGKREGERNINQNDYFHRELYWGSFSRTILLPQEVDPEEAEAVEKHGLLIIRLPKLNKNKQTKLKVKTN